MDITSNVKGFFLSDIGLENMQKKKYLFYINVLGGGGAERVISRLASFFAAEGHDVMLVTSFPLEKEYPVHQNVQRICLEKSEKKQNLLMRNLSRISKLRQLCRLYRPDAVISFMMEPNFRAILATIGLPVKTIVSVRNDPNREYAGTVGKFVSNFILPMADGCVFQTEDAKCWFPEKLQKKSAVIMNAVDERFFEIHRETNGNIVTVGRLSEQKNHALLIDAFVEIEHRYPDRKLLIYGTGACEEQLEQQIQANQLQGRVLLMGTTDKVHEVLSKAGVFVLSSDYEGMPNALMEALAAGVPCISTDCPCGGPRALIHHGQDGLLVPVGDQVVLAGALDHLLSNTEMAEKMGRNARQNAKQFEPKTVLEKWKDFFDTIV